jgi:hypothetical protein
VTGGERKGVGLHSSSYDFETQAEHLLACLKAGTVSTNVYLRKLHNFCLAMSWLPWSIIPKRPWHFHPLEPIQIRFAPWCWPA